MRERDTPSAHGPRPGRTPARQAPAEKGATLSTRAWIGCGTLLLAMPGIGFGGAHHLGWFGPEDVYSAPWEPCELLDVDAAREIAGNGENLRIQASGYSYAYDSGDLECTVFPGHGAASGHRVRLGTLLFLSEADGLRKENGAEVATAYLHDRRSKWNDAEPAACPDGGTPLSGTTRYGSGHALYRMDNLVAEVEVWPADAWVEAKLDEANRVQTAVDLLCDAVSHVR